MRLFRSFHTIWIFTYDSSWILFTIQKQKDFFQESFGIDPICQCLDKDVGMYCRKLQIVSQKYTDKNIANFHFEFPIRWILNVIQEKFAKNST